MIHATYSIFFIPCFMLYIPSSIFHIPSLYTFYLKAVLKRIPLLTERWECQDFGSPRGCFVSAPVYFTSAGSGSATGGPAEFGLLSVRNDDVVLFKGVA